MAVVRRNVGRPLLASEVQAQQVRKLHKAGQSLRAIQEETSLGLQTVRTILSKDTRTDRTTKRLLQRIDPGRFKEEPWRERTRRSLPKRISETLEQGHDAVRAAKDLN